MEVLYVLWLRQIKKYWRSRARMIGSLGQPLLFLIAFGFGFGSIYQKAEGGNFIQFLAPGIIAMSILFTAMFTGIELIWDRQFGFLKETLVAPVSRPKIMLGRTLGGATVSVFQGVVVLLVSLLVGFKIGNPALLPLAILFMFLIALLFTAFGTAIASRMEDMQAFPLVMNFIIMPIFFFSGALFPLEGLSGPIEAVTNFNPLTYGVDGLRGALGGAYHLGLFADLAVLALTTIFLFGLGSYLFSTIEI
ncbi:MAG TPA: ABC transporter permease [Candidatus Nanoarchaeia archaeon]|nr:ABC transporter permease [Candidatus Nanoarchaeia archaeon]